MGSEDGNTRGSRTALHITLSLSIAIAGEKIMVKKSLSTMFRSRRMGSAGFTLSSSFARGHHLISVGRFAQ